MNQWSTEICRVALILHVQLTCGFYYQLFIFEISVSFACVTKIELANLLHKDSCLHLLVTSW